MTRIDRKKARKLYDKLMMQAAVMSPAMIEQLRLLYTLLSGQVEDTNHRSPIDKVLQGVDPKQVVAELTTSANLGAKIPKPMCLVKKTRKKENND